MLKPQVIVVVLKLCGYAPNARPPYGAIAAELKMSASEIHSAVQRLKSSRLLHGSEIDEKPNLSSLEEFLIHGIKYAFPAMRG